MIRVVREDSGFSLIEVLVSAALVVVAAGGVLGGVATFSKASGSQRERAQASALAEQQLERLKAKQPSVLASYVSSPPSDTTWVDNGVTYTTHTTAEWANENSSGSGCAGNTDLTRFVRAKARVSWTKTGAPARQIDQSTLVGYPSTGGRLMVQIYNAAKDAQPNILVSVMGPEPHSAQTTAAGCVGWDNLPTGDYTISITKPSASDYVDPSGNTAPSKVVTVTAGKAQSVSFDYAQGGQIFAARAWVQGPVTTTALAGEGFTTLTVSHPSLPQGSITYGSPSSYSPTLTSGVLWPYPTAYEVRAGTCETSSTATELYTATVQPGISNTPPTNSTDSNGIRLDGVDLTVQRDGAAAAGTVYFTRRSDACTATPTLPPIDTNGVGKLRFPAVPPGRYDICAEAQFNPSGAPGLGWYKKVAADKDLRNWSPPGAFNINITGSTPGRCP